VNLEAGKSVLVIGRYYPDAFALHITETFEAMGHPVVQFDVTFKLDTQASTLKRNIDAVRTRFADLTRGVPAVRRRFGKRLEAAARSAPIGLTVVCHDYLDPSEIDLVRAATGAPVTMWFPDAISNFGRSWFLNGNYDGVFLKDPYAVVTLRRALDKPIYYLPEAFNPARHDAPPLGDADFAEFGCDICTAGNMYSYRAEFYARLADYDVRIWGSPVALWMRVDPIKDMIQGRYVVNADKARAFRAAKVCLNSLNPAEIWGVNARAFEMAGIGGFQLIDWRPALSDLFVDGEEIVSFQDMADLRDKLDHYLGNDAERAAIAARGRERALRDHTFERRLRLLVDTVLGDADGNPIPPLEVVRRDV
jgi:spore maturation protein CgeB